jgi:transposase
MKYVGLDVHLKATVWCCLDETGEVVARGKAATTAQGLEELVQRLGAEDELLMGQEAGKQSYFVYDIITATGTRLLTFNAHHLRMISSSRKKSDRRDAYWIARSLQTGMMPHPVFIPTGEVRELRGLLAQREAIVADRTRWLVRAKTLLHAKGQGLSRTPGSHRWLALALSHSDGLDALTAERVEQCQRMHVALSEELALVDARLHELAKDNEVIRRLQTIPAVGERVAVTVYAWVGDVSRFPNARALASYAGLVPSVRQSADTTRTGGITKEGSNALRRVLVQAGHVLLWRCRSEQAAPMRALADRVHAGRGRRKIAVVAAARHILKIAYYLLRDGTSYDPTLLRPPERKAAPQPAARATA